MEKIIDYKKKILDIIGAGNEIMLVDEIKELSSMMGCYENKDLMLYELFSDIYDEIFYDLATNKISISNDTKKLLEFLALPVNNETLMLKEKILNKFLKSN